MRPKATLIDLQRELCRVNGVDFLPSPPASKIGVALATLNQEPLNGLRHLPVGDTSGWYIWGGEHLGQEEDFFKPLHLEHLATRCPQIMRFLGLPPGWRFLLGRDQEEVWFDPSVVHR